MKIFLHVLVFCFACSLCFSIQAQCLVTTTLTSPNYGSGLGPGVTQGHGQQIKVCEGGTVTSVAMSRQTCNNANTTGKLELYRSSTSFTNLVWTRDGFPVPLGSSTSGPYWMTIDFTIGQGTNYTLDLDEVVTFRFHRINNLSYFFHVNDNNPYSDGMLVTSTYLPWNNGIRDWLMRVAMNGASLPVDYIQDLWCKPENGRVVLSWVTANEINNLGFDIQRSHDGINFETIGWVDGNGNETGPIRYHFVDDFPLTGRNYYRLQQNDYDGRFDYSHITHIYVKRSGGDIQIYPNPASDIIRVNAEEGETYQILDHLMQAVHGGFLQTSKEITIGDFKPGIYYLHLQRENEFLRFVKW